MSLVDLSPEWQTDPVFKWCKQVKCVWQLSNRLRKSDHFFQYLDTFCMLMTDIYFFETLALLKRASFWPPSMVYISVIDTQTLQITFLHAFKGSCTLLCLGFWFYSISTICQSAEYIWEKRHYSSTAAAAAVAGPVIILPQFESFYTVRLDMTGRYLINWPFY